MAPFASRPPYATDDDDSVFDAAVPTSRVRVQRPAVVDNPNDRTSAYNTYDSYHNERNSHADASAGIGGALLAIDSDSDSDETDLHSVPPQRNADTTGRAALYAAASGMNNPPTHSSSPTRSPTSPAPPYSPPASGRMPTDSKPMLGASAPLSSGASSSRVPSPSGQSSLVSPRPVYAPNSPSRQAAFDVHSAPQHAPAGLTVQIPAPPSANLRTEFDAYGPSKPTAALMAPPANGGAGTPSSAGFGSAPGSPMHPLPLQAPSTPITPVFAAPPRTVNFDEKGFNTPILRGDKEETLLARRGEKGDDFWRRFSMVAKQENSKPATQKTSQWLRGAQSKGSSMSRCVWVVAVILLLALGGGIGVGWYFTHNNPDHTRPTAIGGSAEQGMTGPGGSSVSASTTTTHTGGLHKATYVSTTHASTTRASTSAAATPTDVLKRSDNSGLERIVRRAFGQGMSAGEKQDLPAVVKQKVRKHQQSKRRAWDRMI